MEEHRKLSGSRTLFRPVSGQKAAPVRAVGDVARGEDAAQWSPHLCFQDAGQVSDKVWNVKVECCAHGAAEGERLSGEREWCKWARPRCVACASDARHKARGDARDDGRVWSPRSKRQALWPREPLLARPTGFPSFLPVVRNGARTHDGRCSAGRAHARPLRARTTHRR